MQENNLTVLLGSNARFRILRLLLNNPEESFSIEEISRKTKISKPKVRSQLKVFLKIGLIKSLKNAKDKKKNQEKNKEKN